MNLARKMETLSVVNCQLAVEILLQETNSQDVVRELFTERKGTCAEIAKS